MSDLIVEMCEIKELMNIPKADRLELAIIKGWQCVVGKGTYKPGDKCIYVPPDSILPEALEEKLFQGTKVKLHNHRIRVAKIRGALSEGLVIHPTTVNMENVKIGKDVAADLGITKYEPPEKGSSQMQGRRSTKKETNPNFHKYTDINNFKNYPNAFKEGDQVWVSEKLHGSNFRCGWVQRDANTVWKKIKKYFLGDWQFVYGSHNVQLHSKLLVKTYYEQNIYAKAVSYYNLKEKLNKGEVVYGEIIGRGIQKRYSYGCEEGEIRLVVFDFKVNGIYVDPDIMIEKCNEKNLKYVPGLYKGPFNEEKIKTLATGCSIYCPEQKVIEGVVIKSQKEEICHMGRKVLKLINPEYSAIRDNSDFH